MHNGAEQACDLTCMPHTKAKGENGMCDAAGGTFIVQLPDCLTTFTVSMLYLLMRSFSGLSLVKPFTSCACDSSRFLVCFGRLEDDRVGALWLSEVGAPREASWGREI